MSIGIFSFLQMNQVDASIRKRASLFFDFLSDFFHKGEKDVEADFVLQIFLEHLG